MCVLHVSDKGDTHSGYPEYCLECEYEDKGLDYWDEVKKKKDGHL